jgi:hypothetical protein
MKGSLIGIIVVGVDLFCIVVGGKMVGGKPERPDEIRGDSIDGGTNYPVAAGDTLYIPVNTPHQFFVEKGKHWVITIVKITPKL